MKKGKSILLTLLTAVLSLGLAVSISACEGAQTSGEQSGNFSSTFEGQTSEEILSGNGGAVSSGTYSTGVESSTETSSIDVESGTETSSNDAANSESSTGIESSEVSSTGIESSEESSTGIESSEEISTGIESSEETSTGIESSEKSSTGIESSEETSTGIESSEETSTGIESSEETSTGIESGEESSTSIESSAESSIPGIDPSLCDHFLALNSYISESGMVISSGVYTCEHCATTFKPYDVLTLTFSDMEEEGYYRMELSAAIPCEYDYYGILDKAVNVQVESGCNFTYQTSWEENKNKIREIVFGENITVVGKISYYEYVYTLVFGEQVEKIKTDCTCDLFSLKEIYFEGDIPQLEADALWRRSAAVVGEPLNPLAPIVYYKEDSEGFAEYGYKLQGCGLRLLGQPALETPELTMMEYAAKTNARALDMATELFEAAAKTRPFLQFYPFCSLEKYKPIKDLAISLTEGLSTDTEKAKAIFDWIVENITYDEAAMYYSVEKVFEERIAVCAGYAGLLHDMLAAVEIPSIYTAGISYFGTECTVQDILDDEENYKYRGNGHGWLICLLDGEALFCDATWGNFAFTAEEFTAELLATTRMNGLSVIPEDFDPALYESLLYYDEGEVYYLNDGYLSTVDQFGILINFTYQFNYEFRASNDGFQYGFGIVENKSAYRDVLICYGEHDYKLYFFHGADYLRYNYMEILKFVAFERLWYDNQIEIDFYEEFVFDEYGTIYHINEGNVLSVAATVAEGDTLIIPETVGGLKVTSIDANALQGCYAKEIILPDSIEKIGAQAFMNCSNIESLVLPKNLKHIEPGAFAFCLNLKNVTMYAGVEFIGYKDNHNFCLPSFLFEEISTEQLTVAYQGTEEEFNRIYFNNPFVNPEELTFDTEQYEHVKGYVSFIE